MAGLYFTPKQGSQTVTTAGTRVALFSSETPARTVTIQAKPGNTGFIYVGTVLVSSSAYGVRLSAGDSLFISNDGNDSKLNLAEIYIDSSVNAEGVTLLYL